MRKQLLPVALAMGLLPLHADDYDYLCLYSNNQMQDNSWAIAQVRKLVFSEDEVSVYSQTGATLQTVPYANVRKITFEGNPPPTDIEEQDAQPFSLKYDAFQKVLSVQGEVEAGLLQLFSANGSLIGSAAMSKDQSTYSVSALPHGVYIARLSCGQYHQSIKLIIR